LTEVMILGSGFSEMRTHPMQRLAQADPGNAGWRRNLAVARKLANAYRVTQDIRRASISRPQMGNHGRIRRQVPGPAQQRETWRGATGFSDNY